MVADADLMRRVVQRDSTALIELERRQGELQVTALRRAELYRGLDAALQTLGTLAIVNALAH
jgi:hypothetical protein